MAVAHREKNLGRNFMGYTTRSGEHLLGVGTSSISEVDGWFVQDFHLDELKELRARERCATFARVINIGL